MLSILTPTYNRAYTLNRLYNSLCEQTNKRFDWIIIDDGSTDNTANLVENMQKDNKINIQYLYQENSGKHVAVNAGVKISDRDWIFIVDSDDALTTDAIDVVIDKINHYTSNQIVGFGFRRAFFKSSAIVGNIVYDDIMRLSPTEASNLLQGDIVYIFKKQSMLNNLFPVIENEKFVPELFVWNKIGDEGEIIFFPKKYIYFTEYLDDGYTNNFYKNLYENPKGFKLFYSNQFQREKTLKNKIKCFIRSWQCNRHIEKNNKVQK